MMQVKVGDIVCIHMLKGSEKKRTSAHIGVWEGGHVGG